MNIKQFAIVILLTLLGLILTMFLPGLSQDYSVSALMSSNYPSHSIISSSTTPISWTLSYSSPSYQIRPLAVYAGKLYAGGSDLSQTNGRLYRYDGISWTDTNFSTALGVTIDMVESLQVFNGRLYIGTRVDVSGTKFARVYYYDGTTFNQDLSVNGQVGNSGIEDLTVHNNTLYAANGTASSEVYQRNGDNNWVILGSAIEAGSPVRALTSFSGSLFASTGAGGNQAKVWHWAGSNWTLEKNLSNDFGLTQDGAVSLAAFNGRLYVGVAGPGTTSPIFVYDGANWSISTTISNCNFARLTALDNSLWAGTCGGKVYVFDGSVWKLNGATGESGILDFAQYGQFVYASTFENGSIYYSLSMLSSVPFFWQRDPIWKTHPLLTNGQCSSSCGTIGACGCTLTSATMVFDYYGANLTPPELSDCLSTKACPFDWKNAVPCNGNKATFVNKIPFSWSRLDQELNQNHRPVILGMHKKNNPDITHWVVVTGGQGSDPVNYTMHDPWFKNGANMKLGTRFNSYDFDKLAIYDGQAIYNPLISTEMRQNSMIPQPVAVPAIGPKMAYHEPQFSTSEANIIAFSSIISGSAWLYRMTEITMTVELTAQSNAGNVTDMQVWSDSITNTTWQPFSSFAWLPVSDFVYARFRDEFGNITEVYSDTIHPVVGPPDELEQIFLPIILKQ